MQTKYLINASAIFSDNTGKRIGSRHIFWSTEPLDKSLNVLKRNVPQDFKLVSLNVDRVKSFMQRRERNVIHW